MYFVILGAGEVGLKVAQVLSKEGHELVLIEKDRSRVSHVYNKIDCKLIIDEGKRQEVLINANIQRADYFIAVTNSDETNILTCTLIRQIAPHVKNIIRLRNQEYIHSFDENKSIFPVDYIVHSEKEAALSIIRSIEYGGGSSDVLTFKNFGNVMMRNYYLDKESPLIGESIQDAVKTHKLPSPIHKQYLIALINRKEQAIIPSGNDVFCEGDEVFFLAKEDVLEDLFNYLGKELSKAKKIKHIIIVGASKVAEQIIESYNNIKYSKLTSIIGKRKFANRSITVIDDDLKKCEKFSEQYPDITVLHADVTQEDILEDLEIDQADMVIATTSLQERNIVLAAHSKNLGVAHTISLVDTPVFFNIAAELGIGYSLSLRSAVISTIINIIRGQTALYSLVEGAYGIFECKITANSPIINKPISTIVLPSKCLILSTSNEKENIISSGKTVLGEHDNLLCIAHPDAIQELHALFSPPQDEHKHENQKKEE